jgi:hypothetical protein
MLLAVHFSCSKIFSNSIVLYKDGVNNSIKNEKGAIFSLYINLKLAWRLAILFFKVFRRM